MDVVSKIINDNNSKLIYKLMSTEISIESYEFVLKLKKTIFQKL